MRVDMKDGEEKFTIVVSEQGVSISDTKGEGLTLAPMEALMLLDILKAEEARLRESADAQSPLPMRFLFPPS